MGGVFASPLPPPPPPPTRNISIRAFKSVEDFQKSNLVDKPCQFIVVPLGASPEQLHQILDLAHHKRRQQEIFQQQKEPVVQVIPQAQPEEESWLNRKAIVLPRPDDNDGVNVPEAPAPPPDAPPMIQELFIPEAPIPPPPSDESVSMPRVGPERKSTRPAPPSLMDELQQRPRLKPVNNAVRPPLPRTFQPSDFLNQKQNLRQVPPRSNIETKQNSPANGPLTALVDRLRNQRLGVAGPPDEEDKNGKDWETLGGGGSGHTVTRCRHQHHYRRPIPHSSFQPKQQHQQNVPKYHQFGNQSALFSYYNSLTPVPSSSTSLRGGTTPTIPTRTRSRRKTSRQMKQRIK